MNHELSAIEPFGALLRPGAGGAHVSEVPAARLLALVRKHHLVVLRGFSSFDDADCFADYCGRLGDVSVWPFGKVLELVEQDDPKDHIFDNNYVPLHWDGMYRRQVPEFQVFHCVSAPRDEEGGRTTFSNTLIALERAAPRLRATWAGVTGSYRRKMEFYESRTVAPLIVPHPVKGFPVIRYNEPPRLGDERFINHPELDFQGVPENEAAGFHESLRGALYAPECFYAHTWRTGDIVVTDNYTLLHGREAFARGARRHLRRVHVLGEPPLDNPHLVSYE